MFIKDYIIIDDALKNPKILQNMVEELTFYTRFDESLDGLKNIKQRVHKPEGKWLGFRSQDIYDKSPEIFHLTFNEIFDHVLSDIPCKYEYTLSSYLHFSPKNCIFDKSQIHEDVDTSFAGVIYLNETPQKNSGTVLYTSDGIVEIENKYNRLVFYKSQIKHKPASGFGTTTKDSRLTFLFFVTRFFLEFKNNERKKT